MLNIMMSPDRDKKYKEMDSLMEHIYDEYVKLDGEETKALYNRFEKVVNIIVEKMKESDDTFKDIFQEIYFTGSFFDKLRITEATEFDLNLILKPEISIAPQRKRLPPGYTSIQVLSGKNTTPYKDWMVQRGINNYCLNPDKVRYWFHGVISKAMKKLEEENQMIENCQLKLRKSGPAWTVSIICKAFPNKKIDIDLVPVLEFNTSKRGMNPSLKKCDIRKVRIDEPWFAVPKPPYDCPKCSLYAWRMSFARQEAAIMKDLKYFKYTLRMVKKVRDELGIHEVASYHIKNLFLLESQKQGTDMWSKNRRTVLFMHMLECLQKALESGKIPYLWNENMNLIGNVPKVTLDNRSGCLKNFIKKIHNLVEEKKWLELKTWLESLLSPQVELKEEEKQSDTSDSDSSDTGSDSTSSTYLISHGEGHKAAEILIRYLAKQGASQDEIKIIRKWEEFSKAKKNK